MLSGTVLGVVLAIAPGVALFYDITPKVVVLLLGTAAALLLVPRWQAGFRLLWREPLGRAFAGLCALHLGSLTLSTIFSAQPDLSFAGSNWRRFGFVTHGAMMLWVLALASYLAARRERLRALLRVLAAGGMAAALYGVLQYFGMDPLLPSETYHIGEGEWMIVRTPGTLGHAGYFANYLLTAVFWALALARSETNAAWRRFAMTTAVLGAFAIVLSGTRGAIVGLLAGGFVALMWRRPRVERRALAGAVLAAAALVGFYYSPWGERLRGRMRWSIEDAYGGGRLLLWRDSLRMFAAGPWLLGTGLETYSAEFPPFLSPELAAAYPNRYYESPHNIFLDALTAQGLLGLSFLAGMTAVAALAALRLRRQGSPPGLWLAAGFAAALGGNQFLAFTVPTALHLYLAAALLVAFGIRETKTAEQPAPRRVWLAAIPAAVFLAVFALRLAAADVLLLGARRFAAAGEIASARRQYDHVRSIKPWGMNVDLWYSRWMLEAAQTPAAPADRGQAWQAAASAGERAAGQAGERQAALYNLALLYGLRNDAHRAEAALRRTIEAAPAWYKPHWMLAQLLRETGRREEALAEAETAHELNGGANEEVTRTRDQLREERSVRGH